MGRLRSSCGTGSGAGGKRRLVGGSIGTGGSSSGSKRGRLLAASAGAVGGRGSKGAAGAGVGGIGGWMGRQAPVEEEEEPLAALASLDQLVAADGEEEEEMGPTLSLETVNANVLSVVLGFLSAAEAERLAGACRALRTQVMATTMTDRPDFFTYTETTLTQSIIPPP